MQINSDENLKLNKEKSRLRRLAWLLDSSIQLPGGFRIGLDGIIGLLPGVGDLLTAAASSYIIARAAFMRAPASVLARMGLNVLLELIIGIIPVFGDLFDIVFRANVRNVELMEAHLNDPESTRVNSRWVIAVSLFLIALLLLLMFVITITLTVWLWSQLLG